MILAVVKTEDEQWAVLAILVIALIAIVIYALEGDNKK